MAPKYRKATQSIFLVLFIFLMLQGRIQLWMPIFAGSLLLSIFYGRFYCGWICPINTVMEPISGIRRRLSLKAWPIPKLLSASWVRYLSLTAFITVFVFVMISGRTIPILPILFITGGALTIFFPENLWHRHLCPYGTLLSFTGSKARRRLTIESDKCISCGLCAKVCPADAVYFDKGYFIDSKLCLQCLSCQEHCPKEAIEF